MELLLFGLGQSVISVISVQIMRWLGLSQEQSFVLIALLFGIGYYFFNHIIPIEGRDEIIGFVMGSMAGAKMLYDLLAPKKPVIVVEKKVL